MGRPISNLIGQIFGYLKVKSYAGRGKNGHSMWTCLCLLCGKIKVILGKALVSGGTISCGCAKPSNFKDLTGQFFGMFNQLEVLHRSDKIDTQGNKRYWVYRCTICLIEKEIGGWHLTSGSIKSCGNKDCQSSHDVRVAGGKAGAIIIHGLSGTFLYKLYLNMIYRCYDLTNKSYKNYGARGITVYEPWRNNIFSFILYTMFCMPETLAQFEARTGKRATIGRIDNDGNYEPGNIQWETDQEQGQNKQNNVLNPEIVRFIKAEDKAGKTGTYIFEQVKIKYGFKGSLSVIGRVIRNEIWTNIK